MTTTLEIQERGVMLPDYFSGTSGVQLSLYIDKNTTLSDILSLLRDEINEIFDHVECTAEISGFNLNHLDSAITEQLVKMKEHCNNKLDQVYAPGLDFDFNDDDDENAVAIFTIEFSEE